MDNNNWNLKIKMTSELEKDLLAREVMKLRRQCTRLYDQLKTTRNGLWDLSETPKKDLDEALHRWNAVADIATTIIENIDKEQKF